MTLIATVSELAAAATWAASRLSVSRRTNVRGIQGLSLDYQGPDQPPDFRGWGLSPDFDVQRQRDAQATSRASGRGFRALVSAGFRVAYSRHGVTILAN
jgi:hypothetical protein